MNKSLVILAAGIGSRYGGFKQMDPVGPSGEFIIDYSIYDAIRAGFNKVVFLIARGIASDFQSTIGRRVSRRAAVDYAFQDLNALPPGFALPPDRKKPWGTAHALLCCRDRISEPFAVINADDYYGRDSYAALARHLDETASQPERYAMVGFVLRNTISEHGHVARGISTADASGHLVDVVERTRIEPAEGGIRYLDTDGSWHPLTGNELVSMNFWGLKPSIFPHLDSQFAEFLQTAGGDPKAEFFLPSVISRLVGRKQAAVRVLETPDSWFGVTYPQDKAHVVARIGRFIQDGVYPSNLWA